MRDALWLRRGLALLGQVAAFVAVLIGTILVLNLLRTAPAFWSALSYRFSRAYDYQLQQVFLPDRAQDIAVLVVGDSRFQHLIPDTVAKGLLRRVWIPDMDALDAHNLFAGLRTAHAATRTRVCNVIVQTSPSFMTRETGAGRLQDISFLSDTRYEALLDPGRAARIFAIFKAWAGVELGLSAATGGDKRVRLYVGKARSADPELEDWKEIAKLLTPAAVNALFLVDAREVDKASAAELLGALPKALAETEAQEPRMTWGHVEGAAMLPPLSCEDASFAGTRTAAKATRQN